MTIDPNRPVPLRNAHLVFGKSRSTIYSWIERGILEPVEGPDGRTVTLAQLQRAEAKVKMGRPRGVSKHS